MGVQSYCFRNFKDNATVAKMVRECGLTRIELCGVHANFSQPDTFDAVIKTYRDAGVQIVSLGVNRITGDESADRPQFEFLRRCGARFMSVDFPLGNLVAALRVAEKLAAEYDVRLGIHNHGGRHALGCGAVLEWVFKQCNERVGLCMDTAWALDSGEEPVKWVERFGPRLVGLHLKDFTFDRARKPEDVVIGTGNLKLGALAASLQKIGFDGYTILEYEGDANQPVPAVIACRKALESLA
jgi:inosose dehydratase